MKIRNKIIALIISLIAIPNFAIAKDGPYIGAKYAKIDVDYKIVDGIDLNKLFAGKFNAYDLHLGYGVGNGFFEVGYIKSSDESKNLGSTTVTTSAGAATISANTGMKFDGYRIGAGYNFPVNNQFTIKPFINYYGIDMTASGTLTVADGGSTIVSIGTTASGSDSMTDIGLGFDYIVNDKTKIGFSYAQTIDSITDTKKVQTLALSASYQF
jgi:hypothetical protein